MSQDKLKKIPTFGIQSILSELKNVTWPTRQQAWKLTLVILIICLIVGAYVGIIDALLAKVLEMLARK